LRRSAFTVDGIFEQGVLDHCLFREAELPRLFGDLLIDERGTHKARANDVRADTVPSAFLRTTLARPIRPCLVVT
jgi:hypothetical protein